MSHCYLPSKFKNNTRKWYFEYFIADYFPTFNKKDPVELHQAPAPQLQHLPLQQQQGKAGVGSQSF